MPVTPSTTTTSAGLTTTVRSARVWLTKSYTGFSIAWPVLWIVSAIA